MKISTTKVLAVIALVFAVLSAFTPIPLVMSIIFICVAVLFE